MRQLAQIAGGYGGLAMVGTPETIADQMEEWLYSDACDGFNIMFPWVPGGLDDFVDRVVPELQRRGLFRREYEGKTLRENLGLPRPENRFFATRNYKPEQRRRRLKHINALPSPVFLKEDKGPDHDVLAASRVGGRGRVGTGRMERPARDGAVGHRVIAFEHRDLGRLLLGEPVPLVVRDGR